MTDVLSGGLVIDGTIYRDEPTTYELHPLTVIFGRVFGGLAVMAGLAQLVVGSIVFHSWRNIGVFWIGFFGMATGAATLALDARKPKGGLYSGVTVAFSAITFMCSVITLVYMDGSVYQVVKELDRCEDSSTSNGFACSKGCLCYEDHENAEWCIEFGGNCEDIPGTEEALLASVDMLVALCILMALTMSAGCCACFFKKRV
ncbi:unnamed protein product [Discosporangium mesarthrocarpum]